MKFIVSIIQIITSITLIIVVLMQDRGEGIGESLGGTQSGGFSKTKRGMEKTLHTITIILVVLFALTSVGMLLL